MSKTKRAPGSTHFKTVVWITTGPARIGAIHPIQTSRRGSQKACREQLKGNLTVMIIPARTDAAFFHDFIYQKEKVEVRFARGRLRFGDSKQNAPFPSMVVIFHPFR